MAMAVKVFMMARPWPGWSRWSRVVRWSGGQVVRWSGGQGRQSVHDGQGGPGGPDGSCGPSGPGDPAIEGGPGGQVARQSVGESGQPG